MNNALARQLPFRQGTTVTVTVTSGSRPGCRALRFACRQTALGWAIWRVSVLAALTLALGSVRIGWAAEPIPNSTCLECHADPDLYKTNAAGVGISMFVNMVPFTNSVHRTNTCASCHADLTDKHPDDEIPAQKVACASCHAASSETYQGSAHAIALAGGDLAAATCVDCHGTHSILPPTSPASRLHFTKLAETCGECHPDVAREVAASVHGKSIARGHREAATCTDCHSEHKIEDLRKASPIEVSQKICSKCHASERLSTKYRLPPDRVRTFMESYHGLASKYGSTRAANCASCHGVHLILPSADPRSSIHTNNLVATCGKCHPGATENVAQGKIHVLPRWAIEVSTVVHYYEAILACLAILVWHVYHVIFDPDVYPANWAFWDGRVSADWYRHEHPLDTETSGLTEVATACADPTAAPPHGPASSKAPRH